MGHLIRGTDAARNLAEIRVADSRDMTTPGTVTEAEPRTGSMCRSKRISSEMAEETNRLELHGTLGSGARQKTGPFFRQVAGYTADDAILNFFHFRKRGRGFTSTGRAADAAGRINRGSGTVS